MACWDSYLFIGNAEGFVHIFLIPKLAPLQSILGHGLAIRHSLSAIGLDEFNSVLYTGDTFGYVKQWKIDVSNGIELQEIKIRRFHGEEIKSIVVLNNGAFIATVGADRCLRLWKAQSFEHVGVFTADSHWDINDNSTYDPKPPYDVEYEHFGLQKTEMP
jgi:WD40 repeat protein